MLSLSYYSDPFLKLIDFMLYIKNIFFHSPYLLTYHVFHVYFLLSVSSFFGSLTEPKHLLSLLLVHSSPAFKKMDIVE